MLLLYYPALKSQSTAGLLLEWSGGLAGKRDSGLGCGLGKCRLTPLFLDFLHFSSVWGGKFGCVYICLIIGLPITSGSIQLLKKRIPGFPEINTNSKLLGDLTQLN